MSQPRTLLLCAPSISSHPEILQSTLTAYDRATTDVQMLDRLTHNLITLPAATYTHIHLLFPPTPQETIHFLTPPILSQLYKSLLPNGRINLASITPGEKQKIEHALLIEGFLKQEDDIFVVPDFVEKSVSIGINRSGKSKNAVVPVAVFKPQQEKEKINGVGFSDEISDDDELIDEDELMADETLSSLALISPTCEPELDAAGKPKKRRRACKDCTCGLKEKIQAEDIAVRSAADDALLSQQKSQSQMKNVGGGNEVKIASSDLAEIDFTTEGGKVGSCGNCFLGDAFRCDGCPYKIGRAHV